MRTIMRLSVVLLALAPTVARADFALNDMIGKWTGSGLYEEPSSMGRMRCRIAIAGDDAMVRMTGRCGSSLGVEDVVLDFLRQANGDIVVRAGPGAPERDTKIKELTGRVRGTKLIVRGYQGQESVEMSFEAVTDDKLRFETKRKTWEGDSRSSIDLKRQ